MIVVVLGASTIVEREVLAAELLHEAFIIKGRTGLTLSNIRQYKSIATKPKNMRSQACSVEARKINNPYKISPYRMRFPSPYIAPAIFSK